MDRFRAALVVFWVLAALGLPIESFAGAQGPSPYRCFDATQSTVEQVPFTGTCPDESPFAGLVRSSGFAYFYLEDTTDLTWNPPGVTSTPATGIVGGWPNSVDSDDGTIDNVGWEYVGLPGSNEVTYAFDPVALGSLPTHVGIVVTTVQGGSPALIRFEAFGPGGALLGAVGPSEVSGWGDSSTDRFFGWSDSAGISSIRLTNTTDEAWLVVDHLQYGTAPAPVPAIHPVGLAVLALLLFIAGGAEALRR